MNDKMKIPTADFEAPRFEAPSASPEPESYCRMFPDLPAHELDPPDQLEKLSEQMFEGESKAHQDLAAGYTYFGQLLAHDVTFLAMGPLSPFGLKNLRTPRLDLDSIYGGGPHVSPQLYARERWPLFLIGGKQDRLRGARCRFHGGGAEAPWCDSLHENRDDDLIRNHAGTAIIPDWRDDENVIISQVHLAFQKAHNKLVREMVPTSSNGQKDRSSNGLHPLDLEFESARRTIVWTYQWLVLNDFLPRVLDPARARWVKQVVDSAPGLREPVSGRFLETSRGSFRIPLEFSMAALRFGHSLVRSSYRLNLKTPRVDLVGPTSLPRRHLMGMRPLEDGWTIDWRLFFDADPDVPPQRALAIDARLAPALKRLPAHVTRVGEERSLPLMTLLRGEKLGLPSGQSVAQALGVSEEQMFDPAGRLPLWLYILKEAEKTQGGRRLGPVGSVILAEVLVGLIVADPSSYLHRSPSWEPGLSKRGDRFDLYDLLAYGWPKPPGSDLG